MSLMKIVAQYLKNIQSVLFSIVNFHKYPHIKHLNVLNVQDTLPLSVLKR